MKARYLTQFFRCLHYTSIDNWIDLFQHLGSSARRNHLVKGLGKTDLQVVFPNSNPKRKLKFKLKAIPIQIQNIYFFL